MPSVLLLDDDEDLLEALRDLLQGEENVECFTARSLDEVQQNSQCALACDVALLDINLGANRPSGIDAHRWLSEHGFRGRTVLITGHAGSHPLVAEAQKLAGLQILRKPFSVADLRRVVTS
jgi:FixJ family two-component response regulator